jgi:2-keto-4-pentenoate hydratase/2-oxohepta-3-ene-1,7-dioic acid hydratase in catechol pathway
MKKYHSFLNDSAVGFETGKAVCIGRNYVDHIKELDNPVPTQPLLFIKPRHHFQIWTKESICQKSAETVTMKRKLLF